MLVICLNCRRIVGCSTPDGLPIDNCYHCCQKECKFLAVKGEAVIAEVLLARFRSCLDHDSPHIGYK